MSNPRNQIFPSPDVLNEVEYGKFVLANLAAKRARQIKEGAPPLVRIDSNHPLSIALAEIAAGKIRPILGAEAEAIAEGEGMAAIETLELTDVGLLLPAIEEEEEAMLLGTGLDTDGETEEEEPTAEDLVGLEDLLGVEDEVEAPAPDDDKEMSLEDLQEQEEGGSDDESEA